ncbi:MAG: hypothetical protein AB7G25_06720 [Sphingomonadaceae bacterium]
MNKLSGRVEKLEQAATPATGYTHIERHIIVPSEDGPRFTGDILRTDIATAKSEWIRAGAA